MDGTGQTIIDQARIANGRVIVTRCMLLTMAASLLALGMIVLVRGATIRLAPLPASVFIAATVCFVAVTDVWRWGVRRVASLHCRKIRVSDAMATFVLGLLVAGLSQAGSSRWAVIAAWCCTLGHEAFFWIMAYRVKFRGRASPSSASLSMPHLSNAQAASQRLSRWTEGDEEIVCGEYQCRFEPNERQQAVHMVFCPPLAHAPEVTMKQLSGPAVTLKLSQCFTYGARIDVRLNSPSAAGTQVIIQTFARTQRSTAAVSS